MTHRLAGALVWTIVLMLLTVALTGCSRSGAASPATTPSLSPSLAPAPVSSTLARTDPAVWAAVRFEQAYCGWDWRRPQATYVAQQQQLATPQFGVQLAADADPVSWREEVVAEQQQVTCTISQAERLVGAPSTDIAVYVRMNVEEQVNSTMGSFDAGQKLASWRVQRSGGQWLVAGSFEGG
jgi:hypothetical protein